MNDLFIGPVGASDEEMVYVGTTNDVKISISADDTTTAWPDLSSNIHFDASIQWGNIIDQYAFWAWVCAGVNNA